MNITPEILATSTWGTGYGATRHLVDHDRSRLGVPNSHNFILRDRVLAVCSTDGQPIKLDFLDADQRRHHGSTISAAQIVAKRRPCKRCKMKTAA